MRRAPPLAEGYPLAQRVLFPVLVALDRRGYGISHGDGLDYLHAFIVDHWARLRETYRPEVGDFEPYLRTAFRQFVLREDRRRRRIASQGIDPDALRTAARDAPDALADRALVREAVAHAPPGARAALAAFFDAGSERAAARELGWTRHRLRTALAEAVAHVALRVGRPPGVSPDDWAVTELVLAGGRTPAEAARVLGRPPGPAHDAHRRTLSLLLSGLQA